uniref:50S ribosomal protein L9, chloroplastic n=1 Tax=Cyanoptyche gloeocystis TaxID=77922 RepID=A0A3G1IWH4_9EUKA|nr:ribosomal protein L9 [Cyanoptyche gloeocystis]
MQIILLTNVPKLGKFGDLVDVSKGYARNFLIPKGFALFATPNIIKQHNKKLLIEQQKKIEFKNLALQQKETLETIGRFTIYKKVGEQGILFGKVNKKEIADKISSFINQPIDSSLISVPEIKTTGIYEIIIKLDSNVKAIMKIQVVPE